MSNFLFPLFLIFICTWAFFTSERNILLILMALEVFFLVVNYYLVLFSHLLDDLTGYLMSLLTLSVAASETAVGLAIIVSYFMIYI